MTGDIGHQVNDLSMRIIFVSVLALILLVTLAAFAKGRYLKASGPLFVLICFSVITSSLLLLGSNIYLNSKGGPVRWQAGIEYWACGVQLEIRDPNTVLGNKIGASTVYEKDDQLIHIDGVIVNKQVDATLGKFMRVVGGEISNSSLSLPVADSIIENSTDGDSIDPLGANQVANFISTNPDGKYASFKSGQLCNNRPAEVQAYVYTYNKTDNTYVQRKLANPGSYVIQSNTNQPLNDCIIVEFAVPAQRTDRLCQQYGVRDDRRCGSFGVKNPGAKQCNIHEALPVRGGSQ